MATISSPMKKANVAAADRWGDQPDHGEDAHKYRDAGTDAGTAE